MSRTIEEEIRGALREGTADEETRRDWARVAMTEGEPPRRRNPIRPMWPLAAAAAIAAIVFWPRAEQEPEPTRNIAPPEGDAVADARKKNEAFLNSFKAKFKGSWVVVTGGMKITTEQTAGKAIQRAPDAVHRFVFTTQGDHYKRGDIISDRSPVEPQSAGLWFFQHAKLDIKKHETIALNVHGKAITFKVVQKSMVPLLLPKGTTFPKFEIPGRMILEDMDRNWTAYRRYLVRVQCEDPKLDLWTEAIGDGTWTGVRLGTKVFHKLTDTPTKVAQKEKRPLLVLRFVPGSTEYLHELFTGVDLDGALQHARPDVQTTVLEYFNEAGQLKAAQRLPDGSKKTKQALLDFLASIR